MSAPAAADTGQDTRRADTDPAARHMAVQELAAVGLDQRWAPAAAPGVLSAAAVPDVAIGPFCGAFIDRWDRRRTMLVADAALTVLIAGLVPLVPRAVMSSAASGGRTVEPVTEEDF